MNSMSIESAATTAEVRQIALLWLAPATGPEQECWLHSRWSDLRRSATKIAAPGLELPEAKPEEDLKLHGGPDEEDPVAEAEARRVDDHYRRIVTTTLHWGSRTMSSGLSALTALPLVVIHFSPVQLEALKRRGWTSWLSICATSASTSRGWGCRSPSSRESWLSSWSSDSGKDGTDVGGRKGGIAFRALASGAVRGTSTWSGAIFRERVNRNSSGSSGGLKSCGPAGRFGRTKDKELVSLCHWRRQRRSLPERIARNTRGPTSPRVTCSP